MVAVSAGCDYMDGTRGLCVLDMSVVLIFVKCVCVWLGVG